MCSELQSECPNKKEGGQLSLAEGNNTMLILNFNCVKTHLICSSFFFVFESVVQKFVKNNIRWFKKEFGLKKIIGPKKNLGVKNFLGLKLGWVVVSFGW